MWPPSNFELRVEEVRIDNDGPRVVKRFRALADGVVTWATSSRAIVDPESGTLLPVFDRMCAYRLVPTAIRALARRTHRAGVLDLETRQGERGVPTDTYLVLSWQGMDRSTTITAVGRVHGPMAEILAMVLAHMPEGEMFELPGLADRPVVPVLRGVPAPKDDPGGALLEHQSLLQQRFADRTWLEDAFALACRVENRAVAESLLEQWATATAEQRHATEMFPEGERRLTPEVLRRLLPRAAP